jgi:hypothetical protein
MESNLLRHENSEVLTCLEKLHTEVITVTENYADLTLASLASLYVTPEGYRIVPFDQINTMLTFGIRAEVDPFESRPDVTMAIDCSFITDLFLVRTPRNIIRDA